ncbi:MAG: YtxH domain-containing protein [Bacteroidota bacterium]
MILCTEYSATEEELSVLPRTEAANLTYPIIPIRNGEIQELTIEGSYYVWTGIVIGALVGSVTGYLLGRASEVGKERKP